MPHRALRRHDQRALRAHADADEIAGVHGQLSCPGRAAAFFTLLRRAGTHNDGAASVGPGSAAQRFANGYALRRVRRTMPYFCIALRSTKVLPPFILWASGASLIWITTASASTPRFFTSACVMSRIIPAFCSSVRPAAMLTVISGIVCSLFVFSPSWPGSSRPSTSLGHPHYQDVDA